MKAVYKHELSACFTGLIGYIFCAGLLLFAGIYCLVYNISGGMTNFEYVLGGMSFVFLLIVPILTMRVLAEERRQKTDQLLYSLPLSLTEVVLGKYFAMLTMFLVPLAVIAVYPLILSAFGSVYLPTAYGAMLGFFLLGAALIAVGTFISSLVDNPLIAAVLCAVVLLLNYFLSSLVDYIPKTTFASLLAFACLGLLLAYIFRLVTKSDIVSLAVGAVLEILFFTVYILSPASFSGLFPTVVRSLALFERFYVFIGGVFDLTAVVYYISITFVLLFLTVQVMEKRRWSE